MDEAVVGRIKLHVVDKALGEEVPILGVVRVGLERVLKAGDRRHGPVCRGDDGWIEMPLVADPAELTVDAADLGIIVHLHETKDVLVRLLRELGRRRLHGLLHRADQEPDIGLTQRRRRCVADGLVALECLLRLVLLLVDHPHTVHDLRTLLEVRCGLQHRAQRLLSCLVALSLDRTRWHERAKPLVQKADAVPEIGIVEGAEVGGCLVVGIVALSQALQDRWNPLCTLGQGEEAVANGPVHLARGAIDADYAVEVIDRVVETLLHAADARQLQQRVDIPLIGPQHILVGVGSLLEIVDLLRQCGDLQPRDFISFLEAGPIGFLARFPIGTGSYHWVHGEGGDVAPDWVACGWVAGCGFAEHDVAFVFRKSWSVRSKYMCVRGYEHRHVLTKRGHQTSPKAGGGDSISEHGDNSYSKGCVPSMHYALWVRRSAGQTPRHE